MKEVRSLDGFQEIYQRYFMDVYKYVLSLCRDPQLAEEITQETFFKAMKKLNDFRGECRLFVWLCQIAKNTYFSHQGKQPVSVDAEKEGSWSVEDDFLQRENAFEIHRILHRLSEPYKEVFSLRVFGELSFKQIGILFGKTENWARVTYYSARVKIKEELS